MNMLSNQFFKVLLVIFMSLVVGSYAVSALEHDYSSFDVSLSDLGKVSENPR